MANFASERDWDQYHQPRNLVLALVGEVGELAEIFQWRGEVAPGLPTFTPEERIHVGEEMSDVLLYLVRCADRCGVDLADAVLRKLQKNAQKYPASLARGKSDKYTAYAEARAGAQTGASEPATTSAPPQLTTASPAPETTVVPAGNPSTAPSGGVMPPVSSSDKAAKSDGDDPLTVVEMLLWAIVFAMAVYLGGTFVGTSFSTTLRALRIL